MSTRFCALVGSMLVLGCCLMTASAQPSKSQDAGAVNLVTGNSEFAVALYDQLARNDGNLFFSPYSISTALGMT